MSEDLGKGRRDQSKALGAGVFGPRALGAGLRRLTKALGSAIWPYVSELDPLQFDGITSYRWSVQDLSALADGADVTAWTDRHSGVLMTQRSESLARPPLYVANAGDPYVEFSGPDFLYSASAELGAPTPVASSDFTAGVTAFFVTSTAGAVYKGPFAYGDRATTAMTVNYPDCVLWTTAGMQYYYSGAGKMYLITNRDVGVDYLNPATVTSGANIFARRANGPDTPRFSYFLNGALVREGSSAGVGDSRPQTTGRQMVIGQGYNQFFVGQIREVVLYESVLSNDQVAEVFAGLNSLYSVY